MPSYLEKTYYSNIQLGQDVKAQTEIIKNQTQAVVDAQLASTSAVIVSHDRIEEGIDSLAYAVQDVEQGICGLKAAFEWGISEVVWQIELSRKVLTNILQVLMAPLDTQAKELRKRAEEAYANGWIEDALEDFLESEKKNKYDFSIHISIGTIFLFQKKDREKALEYFDKAVKYARPKSPYHTSFALLYRALIKRELGLIEEAERCTAEAVELSPDFAEALYQNAQYNALLINVRESIDNLEKAIKLDSNYCLKASNDRSFDTIRNDVDKLFERLRDEKREWVKGKHDQIKNKHNTFLSLIEKIYNDVSIDVKDFEFKDCEDKIQTQIERMETLIRRNSYLDLLEVNDIFLENLKESEDKNLPPGKSI